jgi:hypothetical protein
MSQTPSDPDKRPSKEQAPIYCISIVMLPPFLVPFDAELNSQVGLTFDANTSQD